MLFCSLEDAFQTVGEAPSPGCHDSAGTKQARKEERKKARRCKGPPAMYLDLSKDADRQNLTPLPDVPAMNGSTGLTEHVPVTAPQVEPFESFHSYGRRSHTKENPYPPSASEYNKDRLDDYAKEEISNHFMAIPVNGTTASTSKRYFGASGPTDEPYADYSPDEKEYRLQPDFTKAFSPHRASLPTPSVQQQWKPITPSGAQTAFIEHLPPPGGRYPRSSNEIDEVMKKLDQLYAKLEDMRHTSSPEQLTSEMLMFISSGIFVLFFMDLLVKRARR